MILAPQARAQAMVAGLTGQAGVLAERGVKDRDRLGQQQGQVEDQPLLKARPWRHLGRACSSIEFL
jgi:hypothetical protein